MYESGTLWSKLQLLSPVSKISHSQSVFRLAEGVTLSFFTQPSENGSVFSSQHAFSSLQIDCAIYWCVVLIPMFFFVLQAVSD